MAIALNFAKSFHIIGMAMLFGGILGSLLITAKYKGKTEVDGVARITSHYLSGIGLIVAIASGLWYSSLIQWVIFKGAGFMHAKLMFVVLIFIFLFAEVRSQGNYRRALAKGDMSDETRKKTVKTRVWMGSLMTISFLMIVILIEFRMF